MMKQTVIVFFAILIVTAMVTGRDLDVAEGWPEMKTVRYLDTLEVDANQQSLDIYPLVREGPAPVIIYIHGGGWKAGDKRRVRAAREFFNQEGFVYVSINYRLTPEGRHPVNIGDVAHAIAWVHGNIADYGGDPDLLFLYGHSAGAHLAALVATDEQHLAAAGKGLEILRGVITLDTNAYDLPSLIRTRGPIPLILEAFGEDPLKQIEASPIHNIAPDKGIPPFLICYCGPKGAPGSLASEAFAAALMEAGIPAETLASPSQNHAQINRQFGTEGDEVTARAMEFIRRIVDRER